MKQTADPTATGARNIPSTPSLMDRARRQSKANGTAVMYRAPFGFRTALPQDGPGDINLYYSGAFDAVHDELVADGYRVEVLGIDDARHIAEVGGTVI